MIIIRVMSDVSVLLFPVHSSVWHSVILLVLNFIATSHRFFLLFSSSLRLRTSSSRSSVHPLVKQNNRGEINRSCPSVRQSPPGQLATPCGASGIREEKNVLKKTQAVHTADTL